MNSYIWDGLPVVIFGVGGLGKNIKATIEAINNNSQSNQYDLVGFVSDKEADIGNVIQDKVIVTTNTKFKEFSQNYSKLGVVIGFGDPKLKKEIFDQIKNIPNLVFPNIISPESKLYKRNIKLGFGNVIISGANINTDVEIGNFNLINLNATIGHDVKIKNYSVINPLVSISGNTIIEDCVLVGTGANILQNLELKENSIIGAGSVVIKNIPVNCTAVGVPAKIIK